MQRTHWGGRQAGSRGTSEVSIATNRARDGGALDQGGCDQILDILLNRNVLLFFSAEKIHDTIQLIKS